MTFSQGLFSPRTVTSDTGGIIGNGPFLVRLGNFRLLYREGRHSLKIPVELLNGNPNYSVGSDLIKQWDSPYESLSRDQVHIVRNNIFEALDFMGARYSNIR